MNEKQETIERLREIQQEITELTEEAVGLLSRRMQDQAESYWAAHIKAAVDSSTYVGGSFIDMESQISKLENQLEAQTVGSENKLEEE
jgi:hypothetical protein